MRTDNLAEDAEDFTGNVWHLSTDNGSVLIDAGEGDCWNRIKKLDSVDKVVVTHSHHDHIDNLPRIVDRFSPEIYAYEPGNLPVEARELEEGDEIDLAGTSFRVYHTPGHRDDSICLYSAREKILFTGDLVFPDAGFGRTDLSDADCSRRESACSSNPKECCEGDRDLLIESIEKVAELDVEEFYPGHEGAVKQDANRWLEKSLEEAERREPKY